MEAIHGEDARAFQAGRAAMAGCQTGVHHNLQKTPPTGYDSTRCRSSGAPDRGMDSTRRRSLGTPDRGMEAANSAPARRERRGVRWLHLGPPERQPSPVACRKGAIYPQASQHARRPRRVTRISAGGLGTHASTREFV
jgi:hypothetical protein